MVGCGGKSMGVMTRLEAARRRIMERGHLPVYMQWRRTMAGARTFRFLVLPDGRLVEYEKVSSTSGTHPHVLFSLPPGAKVVYEVWYERTSSGATNKLTVTRYKVEGGRLVPEGSISVELPRDIMLEEDEVKTIAKLVGYALKLGRELREVLNEIVGSIISEFAVA